MTRRAFVIVLDSLGVGHAPDAKAYGDEGAATLQHIVCSYPQLSIPTLRSLGLGEAAGISALNAPPHDGTLVARRLREVSAGKDTTTGHWELMGFELKRPFPVFPEGFPPDIISALERYSNRRVVCNAPASGTEVIERFGAVHLAEGTLIVYTSADSVFQIAAHEDVVSLEELYDLCAFMRNKVLVGDAAVGRVIARPFLGSPSEGFYRTSHRHDFGVAPWEETTLNRLSDRGVHVTGVGKISDIFSGSGVSTSLPTASNEEGMATLDQLAVTQNDGLIFANLVDFDMVWGHRRDLRGYARGLEAFDLWLSRFMVSLKDDDMLIITADHGCDPTFKGTDHTREMVPALWYCPRPDVEIAVEGDTMKTVGVSVESWLR